MEEPNFAEENKLWKQGIEVVVGLDEVGRGPLAGPVVAAAVYFESSLRGAKRRGNLNTEIASPWLAMTGVNDSKKLSEKKREELYQILTSHPDVKWAIGIIDESVIDRVNILEATKLAMKQAVKALPKPADCLLIDGNFLLDNIDINQKAIVRGDQKVFSIAAASIIAKVTRDRIMQTMHQEYPSYRFDLHKGYGTALHIAHLKTFGPSKIHRKSFYPVSSYFV